MEKIFKYMSSSSKPDDLQQLGFSKETVQRIEEADASRSLYRFFSASDAMLTRIISIQARSALPYI